MLNKAPSFAERLAFHIKNNPASTSSTLQRQAASTVTPYGVIIPLCLGGLL